jgi:DNA-binding transcriptional MerR regulator
MLISELARRVDLPIHTIRFYERQGLLDETLTNRSDNNYRRYFEEAVHQITMIKRGQSAGFTLSEIRELIHLWKSGELTWEEKEAIVMQKVDAVEKKIAELQQMRAYLLAKLPLLKIDNTEELVNFDPSTMLLKT